MTHSLFLISKKGAPNSSAKPAPSSSITHTIHPNSDGLPTTSVAFWQNTPSVSETTTVGATYSTPMTNANKFKSPKASHTKYPIKIIYNMPAVSSHSYLPSVHSSLHQNFTSAKMRSLLAHPLLKKKSSVILPSHLSTVR